MLRSVWSVWFDTNQGAFAMVLRIFDCDLCMVATLDIYIYLWEMLYSNFLTCCCLLRCSICFLPRTNLFVLATDFRNRLLLSDDNEENWRFFHTHFNGLRSHYSTDLLFNMYVASYVNGHTIRGIQEAKNWEIKRCDKRKPTHPSGTWIQIVMVISIRLLLAELNHHV
jgi:hypothetical protein